MYGFDSSIEWFTAAQQDMECQLKLMCMYVSRYGCVSWVATVLSSRACNNMLPGLKDNQSGNNDTTSVYCDWSTAVKLQ